MHTALHKANNVLKMSENVTMRQLHIDSTPKCNINIIITTLWWFKFRRLVWIHLSIYQTQNLSTKTAYNSVHFLCVPGCCPSPSPSGSRHRSQHATLTCDTCSITAFQKRRSAWCGSIGMKCVSYIMLSGALRRTTSLSGRKYTEYERNCPPKSI